MRDDLFDDQRRRDPVTPDLRRIDDDDAILPTVGGLTSSPAWES